MPETHTGGSNIEPTPQAIRNGRLLAAGVFIFLGLVVLVGVLSLFASVQSNFFNNSYQNCMVTEKFSGSSGKSSTRYYGVETNCGVFTVQGADRVKIWDSLHEDQAYNFDTTGLQFELLTWRPIIRSFVPTT